MKWNFLYQITAASRTLGLPPSDPRSDCHLSSTEFVEPLPEQNSWVRHWFHSFSSEKIQTVEVASKECVHRQ